MKQPRFELLDQDGRVLATAPLTDDVLAEADLHGVVKEVSLNLSIAVSGRATHYKTVDSNGVVVIGPIVKIDPSVSTGLPMYLTRVELRAGERLTGAFRTTTIKEGESR